MSRPTTVIEPASGWMTPVATFISVDLPAPFSPSRACTSARRTSIETSFSAATPANDFDTPRMTRVSSDSSAGRPGSAATVGAAAVPVPSRSAVSGAVVRGAVVSGAVDPSGRETAVPVPGAPVAVGCSFTGPASCAAMTVVSG